MFPSFRTVGYAWGQPLEFTANHVDESRLQSMRYEIDQIGDSVLSAINEHCEYICGECTGNDKQATTSTVINELLSSKLSHSFFMCEPCPSKTTHRELTLEEHEVYASDGTVQNCRTIDARIFEFWRACVQEPVWLDWDLVKHGQKVFYRYSGSAAMGLLYYSLVGGLSAPKIVKVLDSTSYLTQNQDRTWTRLNETLEMVLDVMENEDALRPGNRGWISVLKVRLLHSKVRMMLLNSSWDAATYGLPINQEDMMSTLLSFSVNVLVTIKRLGGRLSRYDEMAYLHLWRYVGFLIGVADEHNPCGDYERAHGALESIVLHLLHPSERSGQVARHILRSVSGRKPLCWSYERHSCMARALLGNPLSEALGLDWTWADTVHVFVLVWFLRVWSFVVCPWLTAEGSIMRKSRTILRFQVNSVLNKKKVN